ncbi:expressed unknown protein [Ectocarpus siliculosus]|uniref:Ubiquitin-like domain-containing protein n=1 Tax=Ectocarpus siliculosus TaxID=2880 RepID=D8LFR7_ECTSI|nr:expressed unknown protein [Ectocarpus siliculosus]|eukprot:CBN75641.1 expressed unknown protein [Ectocarpus siliculosus]
MRKLAYAWMIVASLSQSFRRNMASYAAGTTRYAVRLVAPAEGPVFGVATRNAKASAVSAYEVLQEPVGAPFDGLQVCVWVDSMIEGKDTASRSGPFCFEGLQQELPINGLEVGSHRLSAAVVAPTQDGPTQQISEVTTAQINVVLQEDFAPSYKWQQVYPWQSVPPGLEVQLPLDGVGQKRARVPPSWRLQLYVPEESGGGFFVRTDLRAGSTVLELRREIARQPRFGGGGVERVRLSLGGRVLGDEETAEGLDLFNRQRELVALVDRRPGTPPP